METGSRPFRFGVNVWSARSASEWAEKALKIEELGYQVFTVPDHLTDFLAPFPALVSAAAASARLRIGTNVLNNDLRHPVLLAREAATVDVLSDGRLQLGLGAGSMRAEYEEAGLNFDRGALRVARLARKSAVDVELRERRPIHVRNTKFRRPVHAFKGRRRPIIAVEAAEPEIQVIQHRRVQRVVPTEAPVMCNEILQPGIWIDGRGKSWAAAR